MKNNNQVYRQYYQDKIKEIYDIDKLEELNNMNLRAKRLILENNEPIDLPIFVGDFETITSETEYYKKHQKTGVLLYCFRELYNNDSKYYLGTNLDEFFKDLYNLNQSIYIYFHNLSFDGDFIIKYLSKHNYYCLNKCFDKKPKRLTKQFEVFRQGAKIYRIVVYFRKKVNNKVQEFRIIFLCSMNILQTPVAKLAKNYGLVKLSDDELENKTEFYCVEPQDDINKYSKRFIEYIKNDVDIVRYALVDFENAIKSLETSQRYAKFTHKQFRIYHYLTIAAISFKLIKQYLFLENKKLDKYLQLNYDDYNFMKPFFSGGLTQFSKKYQKSNVALNKTMFIDVNSAYPYVMSDDLPYGKLLDEKPFMQRVCKWYHIYIKSAKIKKEYDNLVFLKNWENKISIKNVDNERVLFKNRYVKELKNCYAFYLKEEWDILNKIYDFDYEIVKVKYQLKEPYLKNHTLNIFNLKKEYKKNKDAKLLGVKILLNSAYGCLAKKINYPNYVYLDYEYKKGAIIKDYIVKSINNNYDIGKYHCYSVEKLEQEFNKVINISAAAYITAKQRVKLISKMLEIDNVNNKFVLSDTDSILFANLDDNDINKLQSCLNDELGGWDDELANYYKQSNKMFVSVFGAKKYKIYTKDSIIKSRFSGVNNQDFLNNIDDIENWENELIQVINASLSTDRVEDGILLNYQTKLIKRGEL